MVPRASRLPSRRWLALVSPLLTVAATPAPLGVWGSWGAFGSPGRCYAIARPARAGAAGGGFATVAAGTGGRAIYLRLSTSRGADAPVTLMIGDRRFGLTGDTAAAWSPDAATDRAIIAAMRGQRSMSVSAVSARGHPFADTYALSGAATAIDAARLACLRG